MSDDVPVVWLSSDPVARGDAARALDEWARARGVSLTTTDDADAPVALKVDMAIGERVEKELDRAREAIAALDADAAERALARADATLRAHPELPHAAWLKAEVERSWAARFSRIEPRDEARATEAWGNAYALDGGRVAGVGEIDLGPRKRVPVTFVVEGAGARPVVVRLDGAPLTPEAGAGSRLRFETEIAPAEHHLVAHADGQPVFASWIAVPAPGPSGPIEIRLSPGGACSRQALASAVRTDDAVRAPGAVCPRWIAAMPGHRPGSVLVARCERDTCGPLLEWRTERYGDVGPPQLIAPRTPWPAWATWTIVGFGAATATAITLVATGALEARPVEQRFIAGGARVE